MKREEAVLEAMAAGSCREAGPGDFFLWRAVLGKRHSILERRLNTVLDVGAVILTQKWMDMTKVVERLSPVSATASPIIIIGVGEYMDAFEVFKMKLSIS